MPDYTPEQFLKAVEQKVAKKRNSLMDVLVAEFLDTVCKELPTEEAHARQAFITAADQAADQLYQSGRIERVAETHRTTASGDPEAEKAGRGSARATPTSLKVTIDNRLPFVRKLEYGIPITVGDRQGNRGYKENGAVGEGDLYGPRLPSTNEPGTGFSLAFPQGWLMWVENGQKHFAKSRNDGPHGFFAKAIAAVKAKAKQYSDKE